MTYNRSNGGAALLAMARQLTGKPYVFGGTWPQDGGTDCDGLWNWAGEQIGVTIARPTELGYLDSPFDQRNGHASDPSEPGDLLWIPGADPGPNGEPGHVMGFVSDGQVFQAEETGTLIGQFPYDTSVWSFRTRPALQLPPAFETIVPGTPAAQVPRRFLPAGAAPTLKMGAPASAWVRYLRLCLRAGGVWPALLPVGPGGYGTLTRNAVVRYERKVTGLATDGIASPRLWAALGVGAAS